MNITVFGSASPVPGEAAYKEAHRLGELLANASHVVITGGYMGTMEAVSRGAAEAGGHTIGVTCDQIEVWRKARANAWVGEERRLPTLRERLYCLIESCDAALALPGGVGTLAEIATMWSQMQTQSLPARPLILIGDGWRRVFVTIYTEMNANIPVGHRDLLSFAPNIGSAVSMLPQP
ncbi:MAG: LOG family protein [Chloroflexi bacterium]|nr:LOG family protein [Chloroflexota bacterium]